MPPASDDRGGSAITRSVVVIFVAAGLLDATALFNTPTFGFGVYMAADLITLALLVTVAFAGDRKPPGIPSDILAACAVCIGVLWLVILAQVWNQIGIENTLFSQATLRTILIGHFLIGAMLLSMVERWRGFRTAVTWILFFYLSYGIYDIAAQFMGIPRFLEPLRNNVSLAVSVQQGAQGWIQLPRLSSLAAEPSHTLMHVALAFFLFMHLRGKARLFWLVLALAFTVGTFSRALWISMLGSGAIAFAFRILAGRSTLRFSRTAAIAAGFMLPVLALLVPIVGTPGENADLSVLERFDSSRSALWMFIQNPFLGVGFQGWQGHFFSFNGALAGGASALNQIHNGFAVYLAGLGLAGAVFIFLPSLLVATSDRLTPAAKGWWLGICSLSAVGGDYLAMPSTWTVLAVVLSMPVLADETG
jgi:hypothetical protein